VLVITAVASSLILSGLAAGSAVAAPGTWLTRINDLRAANGRARLVEDPQATAVAQRWSQYLAATKVLAHNPAYKVQVSTPWYRIAENVGTGRSEATVFQTFVASTGHRQNMLRPEHNRVGIGHVVAGGRVWTTHIFLATGVRAA
jgi:uncharacterized protein YkwD